MSASDSATVASCSGLPEATRRPPIFAGREVASVERAYGFQNIGARNRVEKPAGAKIVLRASESDSLQYLQRVARCHVDTYAFTHQSPADDPLGVPGANVDVRAVDGGYAILVTADDRDAANEVFARARELSTRPAQ